MVVHMSPWPALMEIPMIKSDQQISKEPSLENLTILCELLTVIANESRLKILTLLLNGELCVCKIYDALELSQSLVSHHLAVLREHNLVNDRRDGKWIYYSINKETLGKLNNLYLTLFDVSRVKTGKADNQACK